MIFHVASVAADALGEAALEPDLAVPALARSLDRPEPWMRRSAAEAKRRTQAWSKVCHCVIQSVQTRGPKGAI